MNKNRRIGNINNKCKEEEEYEIMDNSGTKVRICLPTSKGTSDCRMEAAA